MKTTAYSQTRIKQFRRCQKQYSYRHDYAQYYGPNANGKVDGLEMIPVRKKLPLYRGSWMHALQEALHYQWAGVEEWQFEFGEGKQKLVEMVSSWQDVQEILVEQFEGLFEEEQDDLGDLPEETERMFKAYLRFWKEDRDRYEVATLPTGEPAVEFIVQCPLDKFGFQHSPGVFKGRLDLVVEDSEYDGLWIWDAKWVRSIPPPDERMMSPQALLYVWALRETYDMDVRGFVFNYGRTKAPVIPRVLQRPYGMLSLASKMDTDYSTYLRTIKSNHGDNWKKYLDYYIPKLKDLQGREALWFDRARIPVEENRQLAAVREYITTVNDIQSRETRREYVPRSYFYSCKFNCDYHDLCTAEFQGLEIAPLIKANFTFDTDRYTGEADLLSG